MYPVCKFPKLNVVVRLFHIKCLNKVRDKAFDMLLDFLRELVANRQKKLPNHFKLRKDNMDLGFLYEKPFYGFYVMKRYMMMHVQMIECFVGLRMVICPSAVHTKH